MRNDLDKKATYWKIPFEWRGARPLGEQEDPAGTSWLCAEGDGRFLGSVAQVLAASSDDGDVAMVREMGPVGAASHLLASPARWGVRSSPGWWQLLTIGGQVTGFVLPVIYDHGARDGLDEATIFYLGVLPEYRGQGLGRTLLRQATRTLQAHGVWRIYCDTALSNVPMIHLFETEGWSRLAAHEQAVQRR